MNKYYAFIACLLGNNLMKEGKYGDAIGCYDQAVKLDWTNAVYLCNRYTNVVVIYSVNSINSHPRLHSYLHIFPP
jgi:tetratricopeptide (TPR) repeat protein